MESMLKDLGHEYLGTASGIDGVEAKITGINPGVVICNIKLDNLGSGIHLAKQVENLGLPFVFISDVSDASAYESSKKYFLSRFLVKPFDRLTLASVLDSIHNDIQELSATKNVKGNHLFIRKNNLFEKVRLDTINHMYAEGNYITLFSESRKYMLKYSLSKLLTLKKFSSFLRVHRSYAVNILKIDAVNFSDKEIQVNQVAIPFGRTYIKSIRELMGYRF